MEFKSFSLKLIVWLRNLTYEGSQTKINNIILITWKNESDDNLEPLIPSLTGHNDTQNIKTCLLSEEYCSITYKENAKEEEYEDFTWTKLQKGNLVYLRSPG